jgi:sugar lactone lactonase YvrE
MKKALRIVLFILLFLLLTLFIVLRVRFGGGGAYPDQSTEPLFPSEALEEVLAFEEPLGNIAVSSSNRLFFSVHPESRPKTNKVLELVNGTPVPYPDIRFQKEEFNTVLGMFIDTQERLWVLDHGNHGTQGARLTAFDLATDELVHDFTFPASIAPAGSFFNDLQVSPDGQTVYIADVNFFGKKPALVVYDIETGFVRRLLENHPSVEAQDWIIHHPEKKMTFFGGLVALKPGIDGIVIDQQGEWLYYGAMTHDGLFRIRTNELRDTGLPAADLAKQVEKVGQKPLSDGLSIDTLGNIYITDVEHGGIARMDPDGKLQTLIKDTERIRWADGCSFGGDGYLYFTDSAIPDQMLRSKSHIRKKAPYYIYRFKPEYGGIPGR